MNSNRLLLHNRSDLMLQLRTLKTLSLTSLAPSPSLETMSTGLQDVAVYQPPKKSPAKIFATTEILRALSAPIVPGSLQGGYYGIIPNGQPPSPPLPWRAPIQVENAGMRDFSPAFTKASLIYHIMMCKTDTSEPCGWKILAVLNWDLETGRHHPIGRPVYWLTLEDLHRQPACRKLLVAMKATRKFLKAFDAARH
ncbi:hypothetical protein BT69DRAFT_1336766 [Atractiella rhizophila]|nr:hypothetical protein BT69DRAFT_1336766 [Atractiella rhizophila]